MLEPLDDNGCTCYMLSSEAFCEGIKCIACRGRERQAQQGILCRKCGVGIWNREGDYEGMNGVCTHCYYSNSYRTSDLY